MCFAYGFLLRTSGMTNKGMTSKGMTNQRMKITISSAGYFSILIPVRLHVVLEDFAEDFIFAFLFGGGGFVVLFFFVHLEIVFVR